MKKQKTVIGAISITIFSVSVILAIIFVIFALTIYKEIRFEADEELFESSRSFESTTFYANGSEGDDYLPIAIELSGSLRRVNFGLDDISPYVKEGFIAVEDKIFYEHKGVDVKRTMMAAVNKIVKKEKIFGASTITQQVIKNISGDNQVKIKRKIGEIIRALHIERNYTKDDILEVYLNIIPMGDNIYGIGAASKAYFGKEPKELTVAEAATLIGITNAPTAYSPYKNPDNCIKKRNIVLSVMYNDRIITLNEYETAKETPLNVIPREERADRFDSWFVEVAIDDISKDLAKRYDISESTARIMLLGGGYKIYTTMNPDVQRTLESYFENRNNLAEEVSEGLNYAMTVTDSKNGRLLGIIGRAGKKEGNRLLNHAAIPHTPASVLKPIALYAPLIDEGKINWATVFDDVPLRFIETETGYTEYPRNSPGIYDGLTTIKDGLRLSKNTIAVRLADIRTPKKIFESLRDDFGFESLIEKRGNTTDIATSPMALGQLTDGVSLLKLTEAYSIFPGEGVKREAISYLSVYDHKNRLVLDNKAEEKTIISKYTARIMNQLLKNVTESGTAKSITLKSKIDTAGKTGTSSMNKDKLFIGYTPYYTAGIWCGYDNNGSITSLSKSHLQIWDEVMTSLHSEIISGDEVDDFSKEGLIYMPYCMDSGEIFCEKCIYDPRGSRRDFGYFTEDNMPKEGCKSHVLCPYDSLTKAIACEKCPSENIIVISLVKAPDRSFPKEITVTDAEYMFKNVPAYEKRTQDFTLPYYHCVIPEGVYVGKSKNKKQFNSNCYIHDD